MKHKHTAAIVLCYAAIAIFTLTAVLITGKNYTVYVNVPYDEITTDISFTNAGVAKITDTQYENGVFSATLTGVKAGRTDVTITSRNTENENERTTVLTSVTVLPTKVLFISSYEFGGNTFVLLGMVLLTLFTAFMFARQFRYRKKTLFFSYKTVLDLALIFFFGLQFLIYAALYVMAITKPERFDGWQVCNLAGFIMSAIFLVSIPAIIAYAGFLSFSNLSLIKHEGFAKNNLFGILISLALFAGAAMCIITAIKNPNSTGVTLPEIRDSIIRAIVSSAFVYFECLLVSVQICTRYAAMHEPKHNQDFIVILGCKMRDDGTPTPLLRGRVDRGIEFYKKQLEQTGNAPCFIPSGGKGADEVMSEAECMRDYLVQQGMDESIIFPETESTTTLENMRNSKVIADSKKENANILISTTNYHVFRSGILAAKIGMRIDGVGAKTKWYFWPNAQMREFIGLLAHEWKINVFFIAALVVLSAAFSNISTIIDLIV